EDLKKLLGASHYGDTEAEGLYLRHEADDWLEGRAKLVRPQFVQQGETHWKKKQLTLNKILEIN
ncbi:MAG: hypothetical protein LBV04_07755, partial [Deferribacteraceae bacterium]|nr:hypothetical protein [Deferribacteraceae bacterium]